MRYILLGVTTTITMITVIPFARSCFYETESDDVGTKKVIVVDASTNSIGKSGSGWKYNSTSGIKMLSAKPVLNATNVRSAMSSLLPTLQNMQVDCAGDSCRVTASPPPADEAIAEQALERLVAGDIPEALNRSGYALTEPLQIEETGTSQYGLIFRITIKN